MYGAHGLSLDARDARRVDERLSEFERAGPEYAPPERTVLWEPGVPSCVGHLYVAVYSRTSFGKSVTVMELSAHRVMRSVAVRRT